METTASSGTGLPTAMAEPAVALMPGEPFDIAAAFAVAGPVGAPTLVFLHGTRVTRAMWDPQVAGLADRYRVVTVDLPGHGALADMPFRMARAVAIARSVIERNGGRAIVIGQSLGGYVAMDLVACHPEMVAGLVLCNSTTEPRTLRSPLPPTPSRRSRTPRRSAIFIRCASSGSQPSACACAAMTPPAPCAH